MNISLIIIFALLGIGLILLEVFLLPGVSIAGVAGVLFILSSVGIAFSCFGLYVALYTLLGIGVVLMLSLYAVFKMGLMNRISLDANIDSTIESHSMKIAKGCKGVAISRLAPIGNADIDGNIVSVKSISGLVDAGEQIEVISVSLQEILVKVKK
ncbi:MAG: nodulation protein NfeD [Bacteroidales bacterium]|nr:MAG: nodulation protein NfeD [Bacteroidales bacterium]